MKMKAKIFVFLVAALFIGTTFAGASIIQQENTLEKENDAYPCPSAQQGKRGFQFSYKPDSVMPVYLRPKWKHIDINDTVVFQVLLTWSGRDGRMQTPVTLELLLEGPDNTILETKVLTEWPDPFPAFVTRRYFMNYTFNEEGTYPVRLRVYDNASAYDEGSSEDKPYDVTGNVVLTTYVGDVESKTRHVNFLSKINLLRTQFQLINRLINN